MNVRNPLIQAELAVRALTSLASHASVVGHINNSIDQKDAPNFATIKDIVKGPCACARSAVALILQLATLEKKNSAPMGALEAAESKKCSAILDVWEAAISHDDCDVRSFGLDAIVQWCSETPPSWAISPDNFKQMAHQERRGYEERSKRWRQVISARALAVWTSPTAMAMFSLLDSNDSLERQKTLAAFGRLTLGMDDHSKLKGLLAPMISSGSDLQFMRRRAALTSALLLAEGGLGFWMLEKDGMVRSCMNLIHSGDEIGAALAAETLCLAASNEDARCLLTPVVEAGILEGLLDSSNTRARSAAASAIAKLGIASKALNPASADTGRLLNTAMVLLRGVEEAKSTPEDQSSNQDQKFGGTSTTLERAVEVLAALITRSAVKDEIAHGSGRCAQALNRICSICSDGKGAAAFGLAHIFVSLSVTNKEVQERQLAEKEMEITPEQLAELQRITKQKNPDEEDDDTKEKAGWRIRKIVQSDGIRALVRLAEGASEKTKEQIALAMRQCAVEPSVRGSIVQQGGYRVCIEFASNPEISLKCARDASWCLGKTLITTNPAILTASQRMGCIAPMLRLCKDFRANDLTHFEVLLGLTNIASLGDETKARIASEKGIRTLEYLQFSENELVRRAATECMTNLMPHQSMVEHLRDPEKMKLWCAFAEDFESDLPTSRAAAGTLAMAAGALDDEELLETILKSRMIEVFVALLSSGNAELCHRACVGIMYLAETPQAGDALQKVNVVKYLQEIVISKDDAFAQAKSNATIAIDNLSKK